MPDRHPGGNSMRVHNDVRHDAFSSVRHVLVLVCHSTRALLSVSTRKLVSDLRNSNSSHLNFSELSSFFVSCQDHSVDNSTFLMPQTNRQVLLWLEGEVLHLAVDVRSCSNRASFANDNVVTRYLRSRADESIFVQFSVRAMLCASALCRIRHLELLFVLVLGLLSVAVSPEEH